MREQENACVLLLISIFKYQGNDVYIDVPK